MVFRTILLLLTGVFFSSFTYPPKGENDLDGYIQSLNDWMVEMAEKQSLPEKPRLIDFNAVLKFIECFQSNKVIVLMRHGEQKMSPEVKSLPDKALQKIAMMRLEENVNNALTELSQIELLGTVAILDYINSCSEKYWKIESSNNLRAGQAAEIMSHSIHIPLDKNPIWDCVNYPEEEVMSTKELLEWLPDGSLPWEATIVNRVIGSGTFERIHQQVRTAMQSVVEGECLIGMTHTQQLNALAEQMQLPIIRLGYYGFIIITEDGKAEFFPQGLYPIYFKNRNFGFEKGPRIQDRKPPNIREYKGVCDLGFLEAFSLPKADS